MKLEFLTKEYGENPINVMLTGIHIIIRCVIKNKTKISDMRDILTRATFEATFIDMIVEGMMKLRQSLERSIISTRNHFPTLEKFRWRLNITISSSSTTKVMQPTLLFQVTIIIL